MRRVKRGQIKGHIPGARAGEGEIWRIWPGSVTAAEEKQEAIAGPI